MKLTPDELARLQQIQPGETMLFDLPEGRGGRRAKTQCIQGKLHRILGVGAYCMRSSPNGLYIARYPAAVMKARNTALTAAYLWRDAWMARGFRSEPDAEPAPVEQAA